MADKIPLEMQVKELEKSLVTIVKAFKDLKSSVKALEEKSNKSHEEDIKELMNRQETLDEIIKANSEAFKRIDVEILNMKNDKAAADLSEKYDKEAENKDKFPLAPMGVLATGSAHARPSAQPPIDTSGNFSAAQQN